MEMLEKAEIIIQKAFATKTDKAGKAYIGHLYRVREVVKKEGVDEEQQCIALLHDLLEDCPEWNAERLAAAHFSSRVIQGVEALTKSDNEQYSDYLLRVARNKDALKVKLADLQDNMNMERLRKITKADMNRQKKYENAWRILQSLLRK
ncbi:MAG: HD domain-containing protein [Balneolaceae bacterium]